MTETILVTGATGIQGGGLIKALLRKAPDIKIHALVRDPKSPASQALSNQSPNIHLFKGNFDDAPSIQAAASGCTSAFLNVTPVHTDPTGEVDHARNLVTACASVPTLKRIIQSSSGAMLEPPTSKVWTEYVPNNPQSWMTAYMTSKKACEDLVIETSPTEFPDGWCILRGVAFFTNFVSPFAKFLYPDLETNQTITTAIGPDVRISHVDPQNVCEVAATILLSDSQTWEQLYRSKLIGISAQDLSVSEIIENMNKALQSAGTEKRIRLIHVPRDEAERRAKEGDMLVDVQLFQDQYPMIHDRAESEKFKIDVTSFTKAEEFFEREREKVVEAVGGR